VSDRASAHIDFHQAIGLRIRYMEGRDHMVEFVLSG
jgi:hypothetical protein